MSILAGLGAVNGLVRGATSLIREFKRPRLGGEQFASLLRERMYLDAASKDGVTGGPAEALTSMILTQRDMDGSGGLNRLESGLDAGAFAVLDADGDGELSRAELRSSLTAYLRQIEDPTGLKAID